MIRSFDFLFYSLYRMFKLVKREGVKDEDLASYFYSVLLWTNMGMFLFLFRFVIPKGFFDPPWLKYSMMSIVISASFGWYFFCRHYFMKSGRYLKIFDHYKAQEGSRKFALIGIVYSLGTFISFISVAYWISRIKWHL
jgi:hypothetical protein